MDYKWYSVDIEKIALAIEADAGMALDDIRQGLVEMQVGLGRITTPEHILIHTAFFKLISLERKVCRRVFITIE